MIQRTFVLRGVPLQSIAESECVERVIEESSNGRGGWLVTINTDMLRRYERDAEFRTLVAPATTFVADGMPIVWASVVEGHPLPGRVAGSSLLFTLSAAASDAGRSVFLLGGNPGTAEATGEHLVGLHPALNVAGTLCPMHGFMTRDSDVAVVADAVLRAQPDIVFVALGCPLQERLIAKLAPLLPGTWWVGVGVSFSFASGEIARAPLWMQRLSLEWLHRLTREPKRLAGRYLRDDLPYALGLLWTAAIRRFAP